MQTAGFEPATFRVRVDNPDQRPADGQKANKANALATELCLHASKWKELHLRLVVPDHALFY